MPRLKGRKVDIKKIENPRDRGTAQCKWRKALFDKAKEMSIVCNCEVAVIIFSAAGNLKHFPLPQFSLDQIIWKYLNHTNPHGSNNLDEKKLQDSSIEELKELSEMIRKNLGLAKAQRDIRQAIQNPAAGLPPPHAVENENVSDQERGSPDPVLHPAAGLPPPHAVGNENVSDQEGGSPDPVLHPGDDHGKDIVD